MQNIIFQHFNITVPEKQSNFPTEEGWKIGTAPWLMEGSVRSLITQGEEAVLDSGGHFFQASGDKRLGFFLLTLGKVAGDGVPICLFPMSFGILHCLRRAIKKNFALSIRSILYIVRSRGHWCWRGCLLTFCVGLLAWTASSCTNIVALHTSRLYFTMCSLVH